MRTVRHGAQARKHTTYTHMAKLPLHHCFCVIITIIITFFFPFRTPAPTASSLHCGQFASLRAITVWLPLYKWRHQKTP